MKRWIGRFGLSLALLGLVLMVGGCESCRNRTPAQPAPESKPQAVLNLIEADGLSFYGFDKTLKHAALRLEEKNGDDVNVRIAALTLGLGEWSDQVQALSEVSGADVRRQDAALSKEAAAKQAVRQANEKAKAGLIELGYAEEPIAGATQIDNPLAASGEWPTSFNNKLTLEEGDTGVLGATIVVRDIPAERRTPNGPNREAALNLTIAKEMPTPPGVPGPVTTIPVPIAKADVFRPGIVGYRLRNAFLDPDGKALALVIEARTESGEIRVLAVAAPAKQPPRLQGAQNFRMMPQQKFMQMLNGAKLKPAEPLKTDKP